MILPPSFLCFPNLHQAPYAPSPTPLLSTAGDVLLLFIEYKVLFTNFHGAPDDSILMHCTPGATLPHSAIQQVLFRLYDPRKASLLLSGTSRGLFSTSLLQPRCSCQLLQNATLSIELLYTRCYSTFSLYKFGAILFFLSICPLM